MRLFTARKTGTPDTDAKFRYCSVTAQLKSAATSTLNTFAWVQSEMEDHEWRDECHVLYASRKVAEDRARLLRDLQLQKQEGMERPSDDKAYTDLLVEQTRWLRCSVAELLANEADICSLAEEISSA